MIEATESIQKEFVSEAKRNWLYFSRIETDIREIWANGLFKRTDSQLTHVQVTSFSNLSLFIATASPRQ
jgi:hypothetical protein